MGLEGLACARIATYTCRSTSSSWDRMLPLKNALAAGPWSSKQNLPTLW